MTSHSINYSLRGPTLTHGAKGLNGIADLQSTWQVDEKPPALFQSLTLDHPVHTGTLGPYVAASVLIPRTHNVLLADIVYGGRNLLVDFPDDELLISLDDAAGAIDAAMLAADRSVGRKSPTGCRSCGQPLAHPDARRCLQCGTSW